MNTCYSFVTARDVIHVASVHQYDAADKTFKTVPGSGGVSAAANQIEGRYALSGPTTSGRHARPSRPRLTGRRAAAYFSPLM
jgi:hypothetical protein